LLVDSSSLLPLSPQSRYHGFRADLPDGPFVRRRLLAAPRGLCSPAAARCISPRPKIERTCCLNCGCSWKRMSGCWRRSTRRIRGHWLRLANATPGRWKAAGRRPGWIRGGWRRLTRTRRLLEKGSGVTIKIGKVVSVCLRERPKHLLPLHLTFFLLGVLSRRLRNRRIRSPDLPHVRMKNGVGKFVGVERLAEEASNAPLHNR